MKRTCMRVVLTLIIAAAMIFTLSATAFAAGIDATPSFTSNIPSSISLTAGQQYTFSVAAVSAAPEAGAVTYQWYTTSGSVAGTTNSNFTYTAPTDGETADSIVCVASVEVNGETYTANSNTCSVSITPAPSAAPTVYTPTITKQPVSLNLSSGQSGTLSVTASVPNLGNGIALAYQWFYSMNSDGTGAKSINGATSASYTPPIYNSTVYYFVGILATNGSENSSIVYSNVVSVAYNNGQLKVTKNPTGETVNVGGSATFIARADNAASRVWRIVSKDTTKTVNAKDAAGYFSGLSVSGADSDTLVLSNIPATLNEWSVECKFIGADGRTSVFTTGAIIRVNGAGSSSTSSTNGTTANPTTTAKPTTTYTPGASASPAVTTRPNTGDTSSAAILTPSISSQPVGAVLSEGETTTLSVTASSNSQDAGVTLNYQWYRNDTNSNANGTAIPGAQSSTYVPDTISGSKYYYVGVWSSDGTTESKKVFSSPVTVTYTAPLTSPTPAEDEDAQAVADKSFNATIIGLVAAMALAAIAIGVGVFFLLKNTTGNKSSNRADYYDDYDRED